MKPLISIIIPVFNTKEKYLKDCMESIKKQTVKNLEIIFIDDGSGAETKKFLEELCSCEPRARVIHQNNKGPGAARNHGLKQAEGGYIAFIDADDCLANENTLESMLTICQMKGVVVCKADAIEVDNNLKKLRGIPSGGFNKNCVEGYVYMADYQEDYYFWSFIYETSFLKSNHILFPEVYANEDPPFLLTVLSKAKRFWYCHKEYYCYRKYKVDSVRTVNRMKDILLSAEKCLSMAEKKGYGKLYQRWIHRIDQDWRMYIYEALSEPVLRILLRISRRNKKSIFSCEFALPNLICKLIHSYLEQTKTYYGLEKNRDEQEKWIQHYSLNVSELFCRKEIQRVVIFGAGKNGWFAYRLMKKIGVVISAVVDTYKRDMNGIQVLSPDEVIEEEATIIVSPNDNQDILSWLREKKCRKVICFSDILEYAKGALEK